MVAVKYFENLEWWMLLVGAVSVVVFVQILVSVVFCCCKKRRNQRVKYNKMVDIVKFQKETHLLQYVQNNNIIMSQYNLNRYRTQKMYMKYTLTTNIMPTDE
ncbi:Hypothetical_protein [Hexamita inflata]|uniref:Hypothetical_protein n=1 Tax=Hexamita inflata TaxID=28002 RepID=A0AA86R2L3_9EUKA|nr:Hypothetical protein HINF_LOCUS56855 [Hexamita inflata]